MSPTPDSLVDASAGRKYWNGVKADDGGMLGGFASISRIDLQGSRTFLARLGIGARKDRKKVPRALEGGAGIGRVTRGVLVNVAETVDVIEPIEKFTVALRRSPGVGQVFNVGLEDWAPVDGQLYGLVWIQWCAGHLNDEQLVQFFIRCREALVPDSGVIVVKENLSSDPEDDMFDEEDSAVTRRDEKYRDIFQRAGLRIVRTEMQRGLSERSGRNLFPVRMYALKPAQ